VIDDAYAPALAVDVAARIDKRSGSFFEAVPSGADTYLLKHILHDWNTAIPRAV
jgi:hypothetical protein